MLRRAFIKLSAAGAVGFCLPMSGGGSRVSAMALGTSGASRTVVVEPMEHRVTLRVAGGDKVLGSFGLTPGSFNCPRAAAVNERIVAVADTGNHRVQVFDHQGRLLSTFGRFGQGHGQLAYPSGVAIAANGDIIVADSFNHRLVRYREDGTVIGYFGSGLNAPRATEIRNDGLIYVTDSGHGRVRAFDDHGTERHTYAAERVLA